jgi:hypothetical protein
MACYRGINIGTDILAQPISQLGDLPVITLQPIAYLSSFAEDSEEITKSLTLDRIVLTPSECQQTFEIRTLGD